MVRPRLARHGPIPISGDPEVLGAVYAVRHPAWPGWWKVGAAQNPHRRLRAYQTSSPHRDYKLCHFIYISGYRQAERRAHKLLASLSADRSGEWFYVSDYQIRKLFKETMPSWQNEPS